MNYSLIASDPKNLSRSCRKERIEAMRSMKLVLRAFKVYRMLTPENFSQEIITKLNIIYNAHVFQLPEKECLPPEVIDNLDAFWDAVEIIALRHMKN